MSKQRLPNPTVFATNVSGRVKAPGRIPRHSVLSLPLSALLSLLLFFSLSYVFDPATIGIPSASRNSCSCTLSRIAAILLLSAFLLLPPPLSPRCCHVFLAIHRFSVSVIELNFRLFLFFPTPSLYFFRPFFSFARFQICNFLCLVSVRLRPFSFLSVS